MEPEEAPLEFNTICPVFEETGECKHGFKCRFLSGHVRKEGGGLVLIQDEEKKARTAVSSTELNFMGPDTLKLLRSKKVRHTRLADQKKSNSIVVPPSLS